MGNAVADFFKVFLGGLLVGAVLGFILSELLYRLHLGLSAYLVVSIIQAYAGFALAEHVFEVSGVMSVLAGAITLAALAVSRIPQNETQSVNETWEMIALVCNSLLFLLVGLSVDIARLVQRLDVIAVAIVMVLLARAATVYSMVPATVRLFNLPRVGMGERHIMWWGGLKGGLAVAIVLSIPDEIEGKALLLDLTVGVVLFSLLVNAPTIRPLIQRLGIDSLSPDEEAELKHGLIHAENSSSELLENFERTGLLPISTRQVLEQKTHQVFTGGESKIEQTQDIRHLYLSALRVELQELKHLYDIGLIRQYSYMEIKDALYRDRDYYLSHPGADISEEHESKISIFERLENTVIRRLREQDWATGILARYQYLRFAQQLERDIAGIYISQSALEIIDRQLEYTEEQKQQVRRIYEHRMDRDRNNLQQVAGEFPSFYLRFETRLFAKAAMLAARFEEAHQHGEIGTKAHARIDKMIKQSLDNLPPISTPAPRLSTGELIGTVPLLNGLSRDVLEGLALLATPVTFLAGDVIIGEGDKGDALYIISRGIVKIYKDNMEVAELKDGDFFGETALLSDQVRTATVSAAIPSTLLRLTRNDVLTLAQTDHELSHRLEEAMAQRQ